MDRGDYGEMLALESSVLRTLCLTVNATGSELKYKIIDTLSEDDFYFPINKALFASIIEMHRRGDYVVYTNLEEDLRNKSVDVPEGLFVEDFFRGELPELEELNKWIDRLKDRSRGALATGGKIAEGRKRTSSSSPEVAAPAEIKPTTKSVSRSSSKTMADVSSSGSNPNVTQVRSKTEIRRVAGKTDPPVKPPVKAASKKSSAPVLSSEGDDWAAYLDELAAQQGKTFETGFVGLDEEMGGLSAGLMVVFDENNERRTGFLKQLTDQIAIKTKAPCLFVSFATSKSLLRVMTLARLSGVPAKDIERGRLKKDSQDWQAVEQNGRKAAGWLKRVFVIEGASNTNFDLLRELGRQLVGSNEDSTGVIVIDHAERLNPEDSARVKATELKSLSDTLDMLVVTATSDPNILSAADVDFVAELGESDGEGTTLRINRVGETSTTVRLMYRPTIHKFVEQ
jgi:hypothetical protein